MATSRLFPRGAILAALLALAVAALALVIAWPAGGTAQGSTLTVNSTDDAVDANPGDGVCDDGAGNCTLRAAIEEASPGNTIDIPIGIYTLTLGSALIIQKDLILTGAGATNTIIQAALEPGVPTHDVFTISQVFLSNVASDVAISGITIRHGYFSGIHNRGNLTLTDSTVTANTGGGIYNQQGAQTPVPSLTLINSTVSGNTSVSHGGGIWNDGNVTLIGSTVSENVVVEGPAEGGGIYNDGGMELVDSTIRDNVGGQGGGISNGSDGRLTLTNSTVSGNTAGFGGGGIGNTADNQGGGIRNPMGGRVQVVNTIIAGNAAPTGPDCYGSLTYLGHNLTGNSSDCNFQSTTGDLVGTGAEPIDAMLGSLEDNGGLTLTHALLDGSPAIDAGDDSQAAETDQRGIPRTLGAASDIGAFEFGPLPEGRIFGTATLQGQQDHSGIIIHITGTPPTNGATGSFAMTTGPSGAFAAGIAKLGPYTLLAEHPYYLPARTTVEVGSGETISLEVELPWGDFNNDGVVDILDLSVTGGNLGKTEGRWRQP